MPRLHSHLPRRLVLFSRLESSRAPVMVGQLGRGILLFLGSQHFCKSATNGFQRVIQRWLKHRWSAAISRPISVSGLCSTPQPGFGKPTKAYRLFERMGRVVFSLQPSELRCIGCWWCLVTLGMTRRWQNIGPSLVLANNEATQHAATLLSRAPACFDVRIPSPSILRNTTKVRVRGRERGTRTPRNPPSPRRSAGAVPAFLLQVMP